MSTEIITLIDSLDDIDTLLTKYLPTQNIKPETEIVINYKLPKGADPLHYRIVNKHGEIFCVHQDFVDLAVDESL